MKRLIAVLLCVIASLLAVRVSQELPVSAQAPPVATENGDIDGSGFRDVSDAISLLNWLFQGGPEPVAFAQDGGLTPQQKEILSHFSMVDLVVDDVGNTVPTIRISNANLQIVNGLGATNGRPDDPNGLEVEKMTNSLGNLIVGYQEVRTSGNDRTGSHNIIAGRRNNYTSFGGLVTGLQNSISNRFCVVTGGSDNTAAGDFSSVSGGESNLTAALSIHSSVSGGFDNTASGDGSSISGGGLNDATGDWGSVCGGFLNDAGGLYASVGGGASNFADGDYSVSSGGQFRATVGSYDWVAGTLFEDD